MCVTCHPSPAFPVRCVSFFSSSAAALVYHGPVKSFPYSCAGFTRILFAVSIALATPTPSSGRDRMPLSSVVKIYSTIQRQDYAMPWQAQSPIQAAGTGFVVSKRRILTNAHVVSDAKFIEIQLHDEASRFRAFVKYIAHDCDLALLELEDPSQLDDMPAVKLSEYLPRLNDEVSVIGYPIGGARLSVTKGVVSRVDYSTYSHSGVDQHLVIQVDAAINPGNSGGPVVFNGKIVGMAFRGLMNAENIGYAIPVPVIKRFLTDVHDGIYNGYPELGVATMRLRNKALREDLVMPTDLSGVAVFYVDPFGSGTGILEPEDVLCSIDGNRIQNDGTTLVDGTVVEFAELLERKQWGQSISLEIWRDGMRKDVKVPLTNQLDPFIFRNNYDEKPRYFILGGLVFSPLSKDFLSAAQLDPNSPRTQKIYYYTIFSKFDGLIAGRDEFVALISILPHQVNSYCNAFVPGIVSEVNGKAVRDLRDLKEACTAEGTRFHVFSFEGTTERLVIDADAAEKAEPLLLEQYGVPARERL